jgi:hypothetical protein
MIREHSLSPGVSCCPTRRQLAAETGHLTFKFKSYKSDCLLCDLTPSQQDDSRCKLRDEPGIRGDPGSASSIIQTGMSNASTSRRRAVTGEAPLETGGIVSLLHRPFKLKHLHLIFSAAGISVWLVPAWASFSQRSGDNRETLRSRAHDHNARRTYGAPIHSCFLCCAEGSSTRSVKGQCPWAPQPDSLEAAPEPGHYRLVVNPPKEPNIDKTPGFQHPKSP